MAHPIRMPKAGQSMTEGKVLKWLKKEGDSVRQGDPILEIETDKASLEVEAQASGVLRKTLAREGESCPVFTLIGVIGAPGEEFDLEAMKKAALEAEPAAEAADDLMPAIGPQASVAPAAAAVPAVAAFPPCAVPEAVVPPAAALAPPAGAGGRVFASPLARRIARERGVDLARLRGTGPGGRVLRRDVEAAAASGAAAAPRGDGARAFALAPAKPYPPPSPRPPARVAVEGMRKAIGSALLQSKQTIPHFYATVSVDVTAALELKRSLEAAGTKVSVNDLVARASVIALRDEPRVNCRVFPERIEYPPNVNLGIAVGTEDGLVVPVVLRAEERDLGSLSAEIRRIVAAANSGKLIGSGQGTFTLSNLGMFGVESFGAIINPPEGAILAVGAAAVEAVPWGGGFVPRSILRVTLSSDHRAIDGVLAARFLARVKHLLENPDRL